MANEEDSNLVATEIIAESEAYSLWRSAEPDSEVSYHLDLESVTIHFYEEEWQEFLQFMQQFKPDGGKANGGKPEGGKGKKGR